MAQRLTNYNPAGDALSMASTAQGLGAMTGNPTIPNMFDGGKASKPYANTQIERNSLLAQQNLKQNAISAQTQAVADVFGQSRNAMTTETTQTARAQQYMNQNLANRIESSQTGGAGLMALNSIMESPQRAKFESDIAVSRAMSEPACQAPELGLMTKMMNA